MPIHNRMSHPLGVDHFCGGECKGCCLGGLCNGSNNLHICTIPQQDCSASLQYKQGYTADILGVKPVLGLIQVIEYN